MDTCYNCAAPIEDYEDAVVQRAFPGMPGDRCWCNLECFKNNPE